MQNRAKDILIELGLADEETIEVFYPRVRDRDDVGVLRDSRSGVIFLDRTDHMDLSHYEALEGGSYWGGKDRTEALKNYAEDDGRRAAQYADLVRGKDVVDVGCGTGGFLDRVRDIAKSAAGVEPQTYIREELSRLGYSMYRTSAELPTGKFDVATLFCTLEHLVEPTETLKEIRRALRVGGTLVIEVPHARDALLALDSFKKFTLWSEHIILHTRESLTAFLHAAGFAHSEVSGCQRYPMANHLGWLATGEPAGQKKFPQLADLNASRAYEELLVAQDKTDTLIALAHV